MCHWFSIWGAEFTAWNFEFDLHIYIQIDSDINVNLLAVSEAAADTWVRPRAATATLDAAAGVLLVGDPLYATGLVS